MNEFNDTLFDEIVAPESMAVEKKPFVATDLQSAQWAANKIKVAHKHIEEVEAFYRAALHRLDEWKKNATNDAVRTIEFMQSALLPFVAESISETNKRSIDLIGLRAGFRAKPEHVEITNEDAALAWANENAKDAIKIVETLSKTELKKHAANGANIPGVHIMRDPPAFYTEVK